MRAMSGGAARKKEEIAGLKTPGALSEPARSGVDAEGGGEARGLRPGLAG